MDEQEAKKEIEVATREAAKLSDQVVSVRIRKDADLESAAGLLVDIKRTHKAIETKRKSITAPLNTALKNINALFKEPTSKLAAAEEIIKAEMRSYQQRVDARAAKKLDQIQDKVDSGEMDMATGMGKISNVKQAPSGVSSESGQTHFKKVKKLKIINPGELPVHYFLRERVLEALRLEVEADVRAGAPMPEGAKYVEESQVAVRLA